MSDAGSSPRAETLRFSARAFSLETIKRAAYRFIDRFVVDLGVEGDEIVCRISFLKAPTDAAINSLVADFKAEVLDQDLREAVSDETAAYRNAILALAFAPSKLKDGE